MRGPWTVVVALALLGCPAKKEGDQTRTPDASAPAKANPPPRIGEPVEVGSLRNPVVAAPYAIAAFLGSAEPPPVYAPEADPELLAARVKLEDAYDYEYTHADKTTTGNETTKILLKHRGG